MQASDLAKLLATAALPRGKKAAMGMTTVFKPLLAIVRILIQLIVCSLFVGCSAPRPQQNQPTKNDLLRLEGIPELRTVKQAVAYVHDENSLFKLKIIAGSDRFMVTLPSGRQVTNWYVECLFRPVFEPFGKQAIPALIDMLDDKYAYARLGASYALEQITGRYDEQYKFDGPPEKRSVAVLAWREWWVKNEHNPRLDSRPSRVYEAPDWEQQRNRWPNTAPASTVPAP